MGDKRFIKNDKGLETLIKIIKIYNQDTGTEFGIEKFIMLIIKSGKKEITGGIELTNQEIIRTL